MSLARAAEGPWSFIDGFIADPVRTCSFCGQGIKFVVVVRNLRTKTNETIGLDCARTLEGSIDKLAEQSIETKTRQAVYRRNAAEMTEAKANALAKCDRLATHHPSDFGQRFGCNIAKELRSGEMGAPSSRQTELMERLFGECLTDGALAEKTAQAKEKARVAAAERAEYLASIKDALADLKAIREAGDGSEWEKEFVVSVLKYIEEGEEWSGGQVRVILKLRKKYAGFKPLRKKCKKCCGFFMPIEEGLGAKAVCCEYCASELRDDAEHRPDRIANAQSDPERLAWLLAAQAEDAPLLTLINEVQPEA